MSLGSNIITLLVEDNADDVLLIQRAYRKANLPGPTQALTNGQQAIEYLAGSGAYADRTRFPLPSVILLDLKLPRTSGLEVLAWMRQPTQHPDIRRIPVVVLTSSRERADVNAAYDRGANSYLVKPVRFDALLEMVRAVDRYWANFNELPTPEAG